MNWKEFKIEDPQNILQTNFNILLDNLQAREEQIEQLNRIVESISTCSYQLIEGSISKEDLKFCLDNTLPENTRSYILHKYVHKDISKITSEKDIKTLTEEFLKEEVEEDDE